MRQKVQFILTCGCILVPIICLCLYSHLNLLAFADGEAPYYVWNREKVNAAQEKYYDTIILGDSIANAAYMPALLSDSTLNLAISGTTPVESFYTLQSWLEYNPAPQICYISFMDFHFAKEDCFWNRVMYFHLFKPKQNMEIINSAKKYYEPSVLTEHTLSDAVSYELGLPNKYVTAIVNARFNQRYETNRAAKQACELHSGRFIARGTREFVTDKVINYDNFSVKPLFDDYYRRLIELCQENGIAVKIIKLPVADPVYSNTYQKTFLDYYEALKQDYPGITVDWFPGYEAKYFADKVHMNSHGALRFSTELKALYPDDFGDEALSQGQVAAINDSINAENKVEEILHWINGRNYTAVVCDKTGMFLPFYQDSTAADSRMDFLQLSAIEPENSEAGTVAAYCVTGSNEAAEGPLVIQRDNGVEVTLPDGTSQVWEAADGLLGVIVVDNYNGRVVCMKNFKYAGGQFVLA